MVRAPDTRILICSVTHSGGGAVHEARALTSGVEMRCVGPVLDVPHRCIYEYDDEHSIGGKGFTEEDTPNFTGSFYSLTKGMVEKARR